MENDATHTSLSDSQATSHFHQSEDRSEVSHNTLTSVQLNHLSKTHSLKNSCPTVHSDSVSRTTPHSNAVNAQRTQGFILGLSSTRPHSSVFNL